MNRDRLLVEQLPTWLSVKWKKVLEEEKDEQKHLDLCLEHFLRTLCALALVEFSESFENWHEHTTIQNCPLKGKKGPGLGLYVQTARELCTANRGKRQDHSVTAWYLKPNGKLTRPAQLLEGLVKLRNDGAHAAERIRLNPDLADKYRSELSVVLRSTGTWLLNANPLQVEHRTVGNGYTGKLLFCKGPLHTIKKHAHWTCEELVCTPSIVFSYPTNDRDCSFVHTGGLVQADVSSNDPSYFLFHHMTIDGSVVVVDDNSNARTLTPGNIRFNRSTEREKAYSFGLAPHLLQSLESSDEVFKSHLTKFLVDDGLLDVAERLSLKELATQDFSELEAYREVLEEQTAILIARRALLEDSSSKKFRLLIQSMPVSAAYRQLNENDRESSENDLFPKQFKALLRLGQVKTVRQNFIDTALEEFRALFVLQKRDEETHFRLAAQTVLGQKQERSLFEDAELNELTSIYALSYSERIKNTAQTVDTLRTAWINRNPRSAGLQKLALSTASEGEIQHLYNELVELHKNPDFIPGQQATVERAKQPETKARKLGLLLIGLLIVAGAGYALLQSTTEREANQVPNTSVKTQPPRTKPTLCHADQHVESNLCKACPPGSTNKRNDDPSGVDTFCDPVLCERDEQVVKHKCRPCKAGTQNSRNDDASGQDTICTPILCKKNENVKDHTCVACSANRINDAGDDASGPNTQCAPRVAHRITLRRIDTRTLYRGRATPRFSHKITDKDNQTLAAPISYEVTPPKGKSLKLKKASDPKLVRQKGTYSVRVCTYSPKLCSSKVKYTVK